MNSNGRLSISIILIATCLLALTGCKQSDRTNIAANIVETPIKAPQFTLPSLDGETISLQDYKGKFVVLHIATTWCPFCNAEAPYLEELHQNYKDKNVAVLLMDVKESKELVEEKLKNKFNLTFPIVMDIDGTAAAAFAPKDVLPDLSRDEVMLASNILIDPNGNIQFMSLLDSKNFDAELLELQQHLNELL